MCGPAVAALVLAALATAAPGPVGASKSPNRAAMSTESASKLWQALAKSMGRVQGAISVDTEIQGTITGTCSDIVVQVVEGEGADELHSVKAFGNLNTGRCTYAMFVRPSGPLRVRAFYGGGLGPRFPGDYPEVNMTSTPLHAIAGRTITRDGELTYDFIK
jgi:hypothetical protein